MSNTNSPVRATLLVEIDNISPRNLWELGRVIALLARAMGGTLTGLHECLPADGRVWHEVSLPDTPQLESTGRHWARVLGGAFPGHATPEERLPVGETPEDLAEKRWLASLFEEGGAASDADADADTDAAKPTETPQEPRKPRDGD